MYRFSIGQICCHREALPFFFTYPIASLIVVRVCETDKNKGKSRATCLAVVEFA